MDSKYHIKKNSSSIGRFRWYWIKLWMKFIGFKLIGSIAERMVHLVAPPHKAAGVISRMNKRGFISPKASVYHPQLWFGNNVYIGDNVTIYDNGDSGVAEIGDLVRIYRDTIIEMGDGGKLKLGRRVSIHPRCQINAYFSPIIVGEGVMLAPNCALYSYDHGLDPDKLIREQPLQSKGPIEIGDEAWLGFGTIVLSGVRIGNGAVIGAGSVVVSDIPDGAIAVGNPAKVIKIRADLSGDKIDNIK